MVIDYYVTSISNIILENILSSYCKETVVQQLVPKLQPGTPADFTLAPFVTLLS